MKKLLALTCLMAVLSIKTNAQTQINAKEASEHIGEIVTVTNVVYSTRVLNNGKTLLNMGGDYPNHLLTIVITSEDRSKFTYKPEEQLKGKTIKVTGKLADYKGKPELTVTEPEQLVELEGLK